MMHTAAPRLPDSSIIIMSSLIPTHPDITMISDTIRSLDEFLVGLHHDTLIYITVDFPKENSTQYKIARDYKSTWKISTLFKKNPAIIPLLFSIRTCTNRMAMNRVKTEFVYVVVEHDFPFVKAVNHTALVQSICDLSDVRNIRFNKKRWLVS